MSLAKVKKLLASAENRESFMERIGRMYPTSDVRYMLIAKAYEIAKSAFRQKLRDNGEDRYFEHLRFVALIIIDVLRIRDADIITAALLHDIVEDIPGWTVDRVAKEFNEAVSNYVWWLSKPEEKPYGSKAMRDRAYHERFHRAPRAVIIIKLADRLHNLCTMWNIARDKMLRKIQETRDFYFQFAVSEIILIEEIEEQLDLLEHKGPGTGTKNALKNRTKGTED